MHEAQPTPVEAPPGFGEPAPDPGVDQGRSAEAGHRRPAAIDDPRALTILTTEHWNLLTARSLVYNEAFSRAGMFLAFLSATLVVLGLISTATGFESDTFLVIVVVVLTLDLFIGLASLGRILDASREDLRYLQGMNRLRHAYFEIVPGLDPYFVTSPYDDMASIVGMYGTSARRGRLGDLLHGFTTTPGMISAICGAVGAGVAAALVLLATHDPTLAAASGVAAFLVLFVVETIAIGGRVKHFLRNVDVRFPPPPDDRGPSNQ
jgi:hypothetical protein